MYGASYYVRGGNNIEWLCESQDLTVVSFHFPRAYKKQNTYN